MRKDTPIFDGNSETVTECLRLFGNSVDRYVSVVMELLFYDLVVIYCYLPNVFNKV